MKRMTHFPLPTAALITVLLAGAAPAQAAFPDLGVYLGASGGGSFHLREWDLGDEFHEGNQLPAGSSLLFDGRLGVQLSPRWAIEGEVGYLPLKNGGDGESDVLAYDLEVLYHLTDLDWAPFLAAGVGAYHSTGGDLTEDLDPRYHLGFGLRGLLTPWLALRGSVRDVLSDGTDAGGANNIEATIGLDLYLWSWSAPPPVYDRDKDGVEDAADPCPDAPGPKATGGCPDADNDGIADRDDRCPQQPGTAQFLGCADGDGDGIVDGEDTCPQAAGLAALKGCPDADKDGIADGEDACPQAAGPAATKGCPDGDGDGVTDRDDLCPAAAGPASTKGCPDRDRDGILDKDDLCPETAGVAQEKGCLPKAVVKKFTGAIKGIYFDTGSAKIQARSAPILDGAVAVLKEYPSLRMRIEGHTDNVGKPDLNMTLSKARADSVKAYLVGKGIAEDRLEAVGFGDTRPAQDNKTAAGKAANRRIEFAMVGAKE